jgi:hypothetical protein
MIKNNTPYIGKIKLKFEKDPNYTGGNSVFNKIHLDHGFTKLVSRVLWGRDEHGDPLLDQEKVNIINQKTGGMIGDYRVDNNPSDDFLLRNHFLTKDGKILIGNARDAWWYVRNNMVVCDDYPYGVAEMYEETQDGNVIVGYYGYTHRGGQTFKIGDRVFEESYEPEQSDYSAEEWEGYIRDQEEGTALEVQQGWIKMGEIIPIKTFIPFTKRGKVVIENFDQAKQAAINISKYLS